MSKRLLLSLAMLVALGLAAPAPAAAGTASAEVLANTCFSCHGTDGKSTGAIPAIAGRPAKVIETFLVQYRDDKKMGTVMNRIAKGFTVDEIRALSRFFASQN